MYLSLALCVDHESQHHSNREKTLKSNKADEIMCSTACLSPPSEDLGTKSDCSPEGSSHRDFHKNYPSMESSITLLPAFTFILSNHCVWKSWLTHSSYFVQTFEKGNFWFFLPNLVLQFFGLFHINPGLTFILHRIENQQMKVEN